MKILAAMILLTMTTPGMAQDAYTEQEAIEERRLSDEDIRNSMTTEELDLRDQTVNQLMMFYEQYDYEYIDDCLTYTDMVCEFEQN